MKLTGRSSNVSRWPSQRVSAAYASSACHPRLRRRSRSDRSSPKNLPSRNDSKQRLLRPLHLLVRETEFCGLRLAGEFRRRTRENGGNSVRRPRHSSLTDRNCEGFCRPGNRGGLPGLHGGRCRDRTDGHRSLPSLQNEAACRGFRARNDLTQRVSIRKKLQFRAPRANPRTSRKLSVNRR